MVSSASGVAVEPLTSTDDAVGVSAPTTTRSVLPSEMSSVDRRSRRSRRRASGRTRRTPGRGAPRSSRSRCGRRCRRPTTWNPAAVSSLATRLASPATPEPLSTSTRTFSGGVTSGGPVGVGLAVADEGSSAPCPAAAGRSAATATARRGRLLPLHPVGVERVGLVGHRDERRCPWCPCPACPGRDSRMLAEAAEVRGDRLRGRREEVVEPQRAQQQALVLDLADHRRQERLLAVDAGQVRAVAEAVAGPHVRQRLLPVDRSACRPRGPGGTWVGHGVRDADLDAVEGVDHVLEAAEVDDDVVVDADVGQLLDGLHRAGRAALAEGRVEHLARPGRHRAAVRCACTAGCRRPSRAGCSGRDGALAVGGEVQQDRGVRALALDVDRAASPGSACPSPSAGC